MKLFKSIDNKFLDIGFVKVGESKYGVLYEREDKKYNYTQCLALIQRTNGSCIIQSYEKKVNSENLNNTVGMTVYEARLALKKMRKMKIA